MRRCSGGRSFLLYGVPFILLVSGGSYGLSFLLQGKYDVKASAHQRNLMSIACSAVLVPNVVERANEHVQTVTTHLDGPAALQDAQDKVAELGVAAPSANKLDLEGELQVRGFILLLPL